MKITQEQYITAKRIWNELKLAATRRHLVDAEFDALDEAEHI